MRTFHNTTVEPHKFWTIEVAGNTFTVTSGQVGGRGRTQVRVHGDEAKARAGADRFITRKLREGFRETTPSATPPLRSALEDALVESPDDRAAQAAYTDLLLEEGDPRGELIQVQQRLEDPAVPAKERKKLQQREKALLEAHQEEWLGELAPFLRKKYNFVSWEGQQVPTWQHRLVRGWLDTLLIPYLPLALAPVLGRAPQVRLLRELTIEMVESPHRQGLGGRSGGLGCLARSPFFANVRVLRLGQDAEPDMDEWLFPLGGLVDDPNAPDLIRQMPRVEELHLWANGYDVNKLFALRALDNLRLLKVYHISTLHRLEVLAANPSLGKLTHLLFQPPSLNFQDEPSINLEGARALFHSPHLPSLTHLQLRMSGIGDAGCEEIVRSGILKRLKVLDLRFGTITDAGAETLAACPDTRGLKRLELDANLLTDEGISALKAQRIKVRARPHDGPADTYWYQVEFE
jgi:uncharacterized protein (TIGR02996 family)